MVQHIALKLLTQERTNEHGVKAQRIRAGWGHNYLLSVLGIEMRWPWECALWECALLILNSILSGILLEVLKHYLGNQCIS